MPFKGRLSIKQYMPLKPTKHGIKFYAICEADTGYCLNIYVYSGADQQLSSGNGFTFNICNHLMRNYLGKGHVLYTDRLYTSVKLARYLLSKNTDLVGTVKTTSKNYPKFHTQIVPPGSSIKIACADGIIACR